MRKFQHANYAALVLVLLFTISLTSCSVGIAGKPKVVHTTSSTKRLPPGQAKKVYGAKSARGFAPGQNKKS